MPQNLSTGDVVELTMQGVYQGQTVLNVFHYTFAGSAAPGTGDAELFNLIDQFDTRVWDDPGGIRQRMVNSYTLGQIKAQVVAPTRNYYINNAPANVSGALAVDGIPSDTNITVSLRTARVARGTTGNKKFTGLALSGISTNVFTAAQIIAWAGIASLFELKLDSLTLPAEWVPIVWSKRRPLDRALIVTHTVRGEVRVLRRREYGKGV